MSGRSDIRSHVKVRVHGDWFRETSVGIGCSSMLARRVAVLVFAVPVGPAKRKNRGEGDVEEEEEEEVECTQSEIAVNIAAEAKGWVDGR